MNENNSSYGLLKKYTTAKLLNTCSKLKKKLKCEVWNKDLFCVLFKIKTKEIMEWNVGY